MTTRAPDFCVIYRWRLRPGTEEQFQRGWLKVTESYLRDAGSRGSRLHVCPDGTWCAYAQWPSRDAWEAAGQASGDAEGYALMREAVEKRFEPVLLETVLDRLR